MKQKEILTFHALIHFLKFIYKIEKYASVNKLQHSIFEKWWSPWKDIFMFDLEGHGVYVNNNLQYFDV